MINALITVAKVWREWGNAGLTVMVLNNHDLNMVSWEQRATAGDPRYVPSQALPDFPFARYAELLGLRGIRVDRPDAIGAAWDAALASRFHGHRHLDHQGNLGQRYKVSLVSNLEQLMANKLLTLVTLWWEVNSRRVKALYSSIDSTVTIRWKSNSPATS